ncbi:MAG: hypothetical protein HOW97_02935 [Catenulispora sp.]|nr:hypothetical protein [Catenulispora sp.]
MTEIDYADGMRWFDIPVQYPKHKNARTDTLRVFALDADTALRQAEDDLYECLEHGQGKVKFPVAGTDYILGEPVTPPTAERSSGDHDWIIAAYINDHGSSHGYVPVGPYDSSAAAEADAQDRVLRHQARLGYSAAAGEIVPIVRRMTPAEAAHPHWLTKPDALDGPPPPPGRYATAEPTVAP